MPETSTPQSAFGRAVAEHLADVEERNQNAVTAASEMMLDCVRADGLIAVSGAGHSLAAVAETFYRAGGLACIRPLYHPELLPLHGAHSSTVVERRSGLAAEVLDGAGLAEPDVLVVFSNSGINPYPVELATIAADAGRPVIAITSPAASAAAPQRAATTLAAAATVVLDTLVPPGDATYPVEEPVTAALSTITNAFFWNLLLTRIFDGARQAGTALPLWCSANVPGGDEANASLLRHYTERVPALR